jgi:hypothetical protein
MSILGSIKKEILGMGENVDKRTDNPGLYVAATAVQEER